MRFSKDKLQEILTALNSIIETVYEFEDKYESQLRSVHPNYAQSAKNLVHYLALRSFNINILQQKLEDTGLPVTLESQDNILLSLIGIRAIVYSLLDYRLVAEDEIVMDNQRVRELQEQNSMALFGSINEKRRTAILVTQPTEAAINEDFVKTLLKQGMDCARINCAHDDETVWQQIIDHIRNNAEDCKIMMDLAGPKIRTGKMKPGPKVIHIKPKKNPLGQVVEPAKIWLAPYGVRPPKDEDVDVVIPVNKKWLRKTKKGSYIIFRDSRNKKCTIHIESKEDKGRWASCKDSAFVTSETVLNVFLEKKSRREIHTLHELLPLDEVIFLFEGDFLRLDKNEILGEPAIYDDEGNLLEMAHISCTLPEIFDYVKSDEPIYFNDGKIEGVVREIHTDHLIIEITGAKKKGGKLKADKGINLPNSVLGLRGLTEKDKEDLKFVAKHADAVNFSFVNSKEDVEELLVEIKKLKAELGIILKIETKEAYRNLPGILLKAMENFPVGVMIARGDLAIETGWKNFAIIQEEILQICNAAHIPNVWATQVLENLAKKGIPTRAEITDVAMAQRADCVMLNKGPYIVKAVRMLDKVLRKMQRIQKGNITILPKLEFSENL
ncbi:pyruvate kinase [Lutimonas zeaxanthinifaciens]|uniref:pyruvate kinase n=1 Tax=Lutimonas zeaxanthinifaciens TaxID=3060215 RepID=UPI00265D5447|nr:pyruvate kinase [Lutimonas sp. YSD2104]WKK66251.1 pyruvate kinase [Lutimonas sp. YSD2104]